MNAATGGPRAFQTIVLGGLVVGFLDMLDALIFFGWYLDVGVLPIFQSVAAGLIGTEAARSGGWSTWGLGLFLHYVVAFCIAVVYYSASRHVGLLLRHPVVCGLIYGVFCHFVMQLVVIPLSAIGRWPTFPLRSTLNGVIGHALFVGLPLALLASSSSRRD